jgi:hypothetical protein
MSSTPGVIGYWNRRTCAGDFDRPTECEEDRCQHFAQTPMSRSARWLVLGKSVSTLQYWLVVVLVIPWGSETCFSLQPGSGLPKSSHCVNMCRMPPTPGPDLCGRVWQPTATLRTSSSRCRSISVSILGADTGSASSQSIYHPKL